MTVHPEAIIYEQPRFCSFAKATAMPFVGGWLNLARRRRCGGTCLSCCGRAWRGLRLEELEEVKPASDEVLLEMLFSPVNPSDLHMVRGRYGYQPILPASPVPRESGQSFK